VVAAVDGGLSRRAAAERFGVGTATAIRWVREWGDTGAICAKPQGGDRRSQRIESYCKVMLAAIERQADITLVEMAELLRVKYGASFAASTIWRFLDRTAITFKKKQHTRASRHGPTSPRGVRRGSTPSLILIPNIWSLSTKPARRRRWLACAVALDEGSGVGLQFRMATGKRPRLQVRFGCRG
jgi:transposase